MLSRTLRVIRVLPRACNATNTQQQSVHTSHQNLASNQSIFEEKKSEGRTDIPLTGTEFSEAESVVSARPPLPLITQRKVKFPHPFLDTKQAWLENLDTIKSQKLGILDLHPDVFATYPRLDVLFKNLEWQEKYKLVDYEWAPTRAEVPGSGRKLWPQKKTGRHRIGDRKAPQLKKGGTAHGPRGPQSYFYMLPAHFRGLGLRVALSVKYAQSDLFFVDSLEVASDDPEFIDELVGTRGWGDSVLFVDDTDFMPLDISLALSERPRYNLLPVYGLNVHSILKHETLVLTLSAVEKLEEKLLLQMHKQENNPRERTKALPRPRKVDAGPVRFYNKD